MPPRPRDKRAACGGRGDQRHHLVDEKGNTIDITGLVPLLGLLGITDQEDDDD